MARNSTIEVRESLDQNAIERITYRANKMSEEHRLAAVEKAMRIVRDRDPAVMKVLEAGAEVMRAVNDDQYGEQQRQSRHKGSVMAVRCTDSTLWKEAYRLADEGRPIEQFGWLYAAACEHAGYRF